MKAHLIDTHLLVSRSRSSAKVKVKYQGRVSQRMGVLGGISVSQTHFVSSANAFNFGLSKILPFGNGLSHSFDMDTFWYTHRGVDESFRKHGDQ